MSNEAIITRIKEAQNLEDLNGIARDLKCNRRFARLVRKFIPYFTTKGVEEQTGMTYYTWMRSQDVEAFNASAKNSTAFSTLRDFLIDEATIDDGDIYSQDEEETTPQRQTSQTEEPMQKQTPAPSSNPLQDAFTAMMQQASQDVIPQVTKDLDKKIADAVADLKPTIVKIGQAKEVQINGTQHKMFKRCMMKLSINKVLMIQGPTGSGKTHLADQLAKGLDLDFGHLSCTAGMSEAHITGRMTADGSYVGTEFVNAYENGGVFLFDEVDAADPNVLLLINSAIANGRLSLPNRKDKPFATKHEDFYLVVAANTWGHGSFEYSGREVLDKAFLDRFNLSKVEVGYDEELELKITKNHVVTKALQALRRVEMERSISTRTILVAYRMSDVMTPSEIYEDLTIDWTDEEISKTGRVFKEALV